MEENQNPLPAAEPTATPTTTKKYTSNIPTKDADLISVSEKVATKWQSRTELTLVWTSADILLAKSRSLLNSYSQSEAGRGDRRPITRQITDLESEMDRKVEDLKKYLQFKFNKNADSMYAAFGIKKVNASYKLPRDRDQRIKAIPLFIAGLSAYDLDKVENWGTVWADFNTRYSELIDSANSTDIGITEAVKDKSVLRTEIVKILNAVLHLIRANYPDTADAELRIFGFEKNKY